MQQDTIAKIEIDADERLHVVPASCSFPYVYREAMGVHWDSERRSLYSPRPAGWSFPRWLQQILAAAHEQGVSLHLSRDTEWKNIDPRVREDLLQTGRGPR